MKYKFDWEKIHEEELMEKRGVENYNYKKPLKIIHKVNCAYCGTELKNDRERTEVEQLAKCSNYLKAVKSGEVKNEYGLYVKIMSFRSLHDYSDEPNFPFCLLGKAISTKNFMGRVTKISEDGEKVSLVNDLGVEKQFSVKILLKK